jgi:hypothetical protein
MRRCATLSIESLTCQVDRSMDHFWRSAQGELIRFRRRREQSISISLPLELPTKRTRPGTKAKAKAALAEAFATDILARRAREVTLWPKPRAAVALDLHVWSGARTGARVDSVCKWLLDELAGLVYADDRQMKMLFARVSRPQSFPQIPVANSDEGPWGVSGGLYDEFDRLARATSQSSSTRSPQFHLMAQTRANVLADLRAGVELEERWDPFDDEHGLRREDPVDAMFRRDDLVEYHAFFNTDNDRDLLERRLLSNQIDYHDQAQQQSAVDIVFSSLFTDLPVDRFGIWGESAVAYPSRRTFSMSGCSPALARALRSCAGSERCCRNVANGGPACSLCVRGAAFPWSCSRTRRVAKIWTTSFASSFRISSRSCAPNNMTSTAGSPMKPIRQRGF